MGFKEPSSVWRLWQALKGTAPVHLSIPDADLRQNWVIITGGNSGVGREAALQFSKWGANLILGCRQPPPHEPHPDVVVEECKAAALAAGHQDSMIEWWECDMGKFSSVHAFGKRWLAKHLPLDILANNAGMAGQKLNEPRRTEDGFDILHQVNLLSHVLLTVILLPSIRQAPKPRVICTTSCMQYLGKFDWPNINTELHAYPNNKLYFQTWLTELQYRLSIRADYKHVSVLGVHPGYVRTNIWHPLPENDPLTWTGFVMNSLLNYYGIDAQQGSLAITYAATAKECGIEAREAQPGIESFRGLYRNRIWKEEPMPQTMDLEHRVQIWEYVNVNLKLEERGMLDVLYT